MGRCVRITAMALCAFLIFAVDVSPQAIASIVTRSAGVTEIAEPIEVDGVLDDAAWKSARKIGELVQRQPATGQPPSERTDVMLLRDQDHLYIGIYAYDAEPDRVIGTQMMRDGSRVADIHFIIRSAEPPWNVDTIVSGMGQKRNGMPSVRQWSSSSVATAAMIIDLPVPGSPWPRFTTESPPRSYIGFRFATGS